MLPTTPRFRAPIRSLAARYVASPRCDERIRRAPRVAATTTTAAIAYYLQHCSITLFAHQCLNQPHLLPIFQIQKQYQPTNNNINQPTIHNNINQQYQLTIITSTNNNIKLSMQPCIPTARGLCVSTLALGKPFTNSRLVCFCYNQHTGEKNKSECLFILFKVP